jgi:hypothetical protein
VHPKRVNISFTPQQRTEITQSFVVIKLVARICAAALVIYLMLNVALLSYTFCPGRMRIINVEKTRELFLFQTRLNVELKNCRAIKSFGYSNLIVIGLTLQNFGHA